MYLPDNLNLKRFERKPKFSPLDLYYTFQYIQVEGERGAFPKISFTT